MTSDVLPIEGLVPPEPASLRCVQGEAGRTPYSDAGHKTERSVVKAVILALSVSCLTLMLPGAAKADAFYFSYFYGDVYASGVFQTDLLAPGEYQVTSITGQRNGIDIAMLDAPRQFGNNDNLLLYSDQPYLTFPGISFQDANGTEYNLYFDYGFYRETLDGWNDGAPMQLGIHAVPVSPTAVPEISSMVMLGTGLLGGWGFMRRRRSHK